MSVFGPLTVPSGASPKIFLRVPAGAASVSLGRLRVVRLTAPAGAACAGVAGVVVAPVERLFAALAILRAAVDRFGPPLPAQRSAYRFQRGRTRLFSFLTSPFAIRIILGPPGIRQMHQRFRPLCETSDWTDERFVEFHIQVGET